MSRPKDRSIGEELAEAITTNVHREIRDSILGGRQKPEGTVTILFTDVAGSTELVRDLGDRPAHAILRRHDEIVREQIKGGGGTEIEHPGDSFMVAFTTASGGLGCATRILRALDAERDERPETPRVRIGMDTGEVIAEERGYFGSTVFRAARVADLAEGGQVLVAEPTKVLGQDAGFRFAELGEVELKGLGGRHRVFELFGEPDPEA
jgi:adenylate cyclase